MKPMDSLSEKRLYRETLSAIEKARYLEKMKLIDNKDPYEATFVKGFSDDKSLLPTISYPDIVNYLIFTPSPYSKDDLKAYKSLNCYVQAQCGWVSEVKAAVVGDRHVVIGKVNQLLALFCLTPAPPTVPYPGVLCHFRPFTAFTLKLKGSRPIKARPLRTIVLHSMRLKEKPLNPWLISEKNGSILASHCDCMAGLGEVCTHVASLMFSIDETVRLHDARTRTEDPNWWIMPSAVKGVSYSMIKDIDFTSMRSLKRKYENVGGDIPSYPQSSTTQKHLKDVPTPTDAELNGFFSKLSATGRNPAILSVVKEFSDDYVPKQDKMDLPAPLGNLKTKDAMMMNYGQLVNHCAGIQLTVSKDQIANVEEVTRNQSESKLWQTYRAGRITASRAKQVCSTDPSNPSQSLIMDICYPGNKTFQTAGTQWGTKNEPVARNDFQTYMEDKHQGFCVKQCGLFISEQFPYIGASPDGLEHCHCCGASLLEIKCPYTLKESLLDNDSEKYCLTRNSQGIMLLDHKHPYYYQVQTQMGVTGIRATHFVIMTEKAVHIELVPFDIDVWTEICEKAETLMKVAILPELVGKFYSKLPGCGLPVQPLKEVQPTLSSQNETEKTWCYCDQVESGEMICCDDENCHIVWFHFTCLKIERKPRGENGFVLTAESLDC
ncbi:ING2-like protein [Mya arenaria]|uniref:ING2-like protein n=1 Tax=Mya arenaria TaxID=6604 RepID=A0ABY7DGP4_MYAAR|nr:ING2-like protein [Mya arenaria]